MLIQSDTRNVPLLDGQVDPNRMFSHEGAVRNLRTLNPGWSEGKIANGALALEKDRHRFLKAIRPPAGGRIVALHNNSNGYSVEAEIAISDRTSLKDAKNPHEFFLATTQRITRNFQPLLSMWCCKILRRRMMTGRSQGWPRRWNSLCEP